MNASIPHSPSPIMNPGRRALLLLLTLSLLPIIIGGGLYGFGWRPDKTGNHGELVQPPQAVPVSSLGENVQGRWLLLIAGEGPCAADCAAWAGQARAIQVSLAKEMGRMRRVVLSTSETPTLASLKEQQPDLIVAPATRDWTAALLAGPQYRIFLVDPAGNLMMRYTADADAKGIRSDLERLLKYSWIG